MTIIFIFNSLKYILNTLIHGYTLYSIYGASLKLLGAFWGTIANILVHLSQGPLPKRSRKSHNIPVDVEIDNKDDSDPDDRPRTHRSAPPIFRDPPATRPNMNPFLAQKPLSKSIYPNVEKHLEDSKLHYNLSTLNLNQGGVTSKHAYKEYALRYSQNLNLE